MKKIQYYRELTDDLLDDGKPHQVPPGYQWIRTGLWARIASGLTYGAAVAFGTVYCRLVLHMKTVGAKKLRACKGGFFLYGNHTQPVGDVVIPALVCFPKRIYTVVSPANLDLPVIGRCLPYLGALPIDSSVHGIKELTKALGTRIGQGHPVIVYPEAHVWPYCTFIRPFSESSFKFPDKYAVPAFSMTTTYQKRRFGRPKMTVYIDGPFYGQGGRPKARALALRDEIRDTMLQRSQNSSCAYIVYRPQKNRVVKD